MFGGVAVLGTLLLIMLVVMEVQELLAKRRRRTIASPYGMIRAPSDSVLRRTREEHPAEIVSGRKCLGCGRVNFFDEEPEKNVAICRQCGRRHRLF